MSDDEIRDELLTLLVAGHETTATQLAWTFEQLNRYPEVLSRLVAEIDAGRDEYVTATIRESLRHRPVLLIAQPRKVKQPIEVGGYHYEPGIHLCANAYGVQHDARDLPRALRVQAGALPRYRSRDLQLDPVRRRPPPLHRRELRDARDGDRPAGAALPHRAAAPATAVSSWRAAARSR